jgi:hypothetical protein
LGYQILVCAKKYGLNTNKSPSIKSAFFPLVKLSNLFILNKYVMVAELNRKLKINLANGITIVEYKLLSKRFAMSSIGKSVITTGYKLTGPDLNHFIIRVFS